jgi:signal transduction histidine kinase
VVAELLVLVALRLAGVPMPDRMPEQYQLLSDLLAAVLFGTLLVAMGLAQEWLRARAIDELSAAERLKIAAQHETQLARADRLSSLGQMAAGVAHELNNPLSYLLANLELLVEQPLTTASRELVEDALDGASRLKVIVRDLKDYSRFDDDLAPVALEGVVRTGVRLARGELKQVAVHTELGACPLVEANETRLGQVMVNLLVNASQAGAKEISVSTLTDLGGNAVLAVRDTGQGIPPELIRKVREPFFTTKPAGLGTGLGLSVCDQLVRQLGGVMTIESAVGVGTTITLILPPAPAPVAVLPTRKHREAPRSPTGS